MAENDSPPPRWGPWTRRLGWCSRADVLEAFHIVSGEIRLKCRIYGARGITQAEACDLARRIKDQRDLVHQLADRRNRQHARRLLRLNRRLRARLLAMVKAAGLDASVLIFR